MAGGAVMYLELGRGVASSDRGLVAIVRIGIDCVAIIWYCDKSGLRNAIILYVYVLVHVPG